MTWESELVQGFVAVLVAVAVAAGVIGFLFAFCKWLQQKVVQVIATVVYLGVLAPLMLPVISQTRSAPTQPVVRQYVPDASNKPQSPGHSDIRVLYPPRYQGPDVYGVPQPK